MSLTFTIEAQHPALAGHFPGNPVVPGVVLLQQVKALLLQTRPNISVTGYNNIKFLLPVKAGQEVIVQFAELKNNKIKFSCEHNKVSVLQGEIELSE